MLAALALFLVPPPEGVSPSLMRGAGLAIFAIGLYATGVIPEYLTALSFFAIAMLFSVAPASTVFAGFQSTALWLVFGGLVIGVAVKKTGLGARLARTMTGWFGRSYAGAIGGIVLVGVVLSFLMPSTMSRVVLLTPVVVALADQLGFARGSAGRNGMVLAMALGTWMPSAGILPANVPNMVLAGTAETLYGINFTYGRYLLLHFPVTGVLKAVAIVLVVLLLLRDRPRQAAETAPEAPPSGGERRVAAVLLGCLVLWATDFVHGISPAWISLAAAVFLLLPRVGLLSATDFNERTNFASVIYVAGILSLGTVLAETGVGNALERLLLEALPLSPGADAANFASLAGLSTLLSMAVTTTAAPAVLGPLSQEMAAATGLPLLTTLMIHVIGYSTVMLPYQVPPVIVAMQLGGVGTGPAVRVTLTLAAVTWVVLLPLNYLWWRALGYL